jgi:hypothetical protein
MVDATKCSDYEDCSCRNRAGPGPCPSFSRLRHPPPTNPSPNPATGGRCHDWARRRFTLPDQSHFSIRALSSVAASLCRGVPDRPSPFASLSTGNGVTLVPQLFGEFFLHLQRSFKWHRIKMLIKVRHQFETVFSDHPGRLVTVLMIFESVVNRQTCHSDIDTRFVLIAAGIKPQDRRMLGDAIIE